MKVMVSTLQPASPEIRATLKNRSAENEILRSYRVSGNLLPARSREEATRQEIDPQELKRVIEELKKRFDLFNKYLKIEIDEELDIPVIKIVDRETNEVVRQIPPEYLLKIMKNIDQVLGLLVNKRV